MKLELRDIDKSFGAKVEHNVATEKSSRAMPFSKQSFIKPDQSLYEAKQGEFHADLRGIPLVYQNDA